MVDSDKVVDCKHVREIRLSTFGNEVFMFHLIQDRLPESFILLEHVGIKGNLNILRPVEDEYFSVGQHTPEACN